MSLNKKGIHLVQKGRAFANSSGLTFYQKIIGSLGPVRPLRFSYADAEGIMLPELNLEENILIDSLPVSQYRDREFSLSEFIREKHNIHLLPLFSRMEFKDGPAPLANPQSRKLAILLKAFLREADFLFLDYPEKHLDPETQHVLSTALEFHVRARGLCCLISSNEVEAWSEIANSVIEYGDNKLWRLSPLPKTQLLSTYFSDDVDTNPSIPQNIQSSVKPKAA